MKKRLLSVLCALALCLGLLPVTAWAANTVASFGLTDYKGDQIAADDVVQIQVGTTAVISAYYYNENGEKLVFHNRQTPHGP